MTCSHNIYIHVPFCVSKCKYCAFFSRADTCPDWELYTDEILEEIKYWGQKLNHCNVPTIFFGGGTPSLMPVKIFADILSEIATQFNILPDAEITIESNPGTLSNSKLDDFIAAGVNRLSVGVQALNDETLAFLGRKHDTRTALNLIKYAQTKNIRLNADFIYGLPHQTIDDVICMCRDINALGLPHVSMYELTIEANTPFGKTNLNMPTNETMADMYCAIGENLNLPRYEISNYAEAGHECRHNQNIWDGDAYIGFGITAAGRPFFDNAWHEQIGNNAKCDIISDTERAIEKVITGLRTVRGVKTTSDVLGVINQNFIKNNSDLIQCANNRIFATDKGRLILDDITLKLIK